METNDRRSKGYFVAFLDDLMFLNKRAFVANTFFYT